MIIGTHQNHQRYFQTQIKLIGAHEFISNTKHQHQFPSNSINNNGREKKTNVIKISAWMRHIPWTSWLCLYALVCLLFICVIYLFFFISLLLEVRCLNSVIFTVCKFFAYRHAFPLFPRCTFFYIYFPLACNSLFILSSKSASLLLLLYCFSFFFVHLLLFIHTTIFTFEF